MPALDELFGIDEYGNPLVEINNIEGQPKQDILLPICYRNPPWLLSFALGLGLGIKIGNGSFAQMFRDPSFWREIGYEDINDNLELGKPVRLKRDADRTALFFADKLLPTESINWRIFKNSDEQAEWIAKDIQNVITTQELDLNDILVVIPDSLMAAGIGQSLSSALNKYNIESHLIGVTGSQDIVFVDNSVAMCSIYRAKGNEAPLVYVVNSEFCNSGLDLAKKRNILFTALTRAKAWVRICGVGAAMISLSQEMQALVDDNFDLAFKYPTGPEIENLRSSYKEKTSVSEKRKVKKEIESAQKLIQRIADGELDLGELPADLAELLRKALK
jgi:superfamily I DNA and RNA helicase